MKLVSLFLIMFFSSTSFGMSLEHKVLMLEKRIEQLERNQLRSQAQVDKSSGLKVTDMNNKGMQTGVGRGVSGAGSAAMQMPEMTKEQQEEFMKQIELYQQRQKESQEILDQIMKEQ